ncbi:hypothetical protein N7461_006396 [Penicillium sp. DV-2018c]|nr:hypothetical protein N7461_006396 [Penicillium sp. DV-2018c]
MAKRIGFDDLPAELRLQIWEHAVPAQIVEIGEPGDPDIVPWEDLKKAWLFNRKCPTTAHVCIDSRNITRAGSDLRRCQGVSLRNVNPRWLWRSTETIHINCPEKYQHDSKEARKICDDLLQLHVAPLLGKKVSFNADIIHPFEDSRDRCPIPERFVWQGLTCSGLKSCTVALRTIVIRATVEKARARGLFDHGGVAATLVDPTDIALLERYRAFWTNTEVDENMKGRGNYFFKSVATERFRLRMETWHKTVAIKFLTDKYYETSFPRPPGLDAVMQELCVNGSYRHHPDAQKYFAGLPAMDLKLMFRLCPPAPRPPLW